MNLFDFVIRQRRAWSKRLFATLLLAGLVSWAVVWSAPARAEEKSVSEEILDILRDKGEISDRQYDDLKKRAEAEKKGDDWNFYWKEGFRLESKDKNFKFKFGGRIMADAASINADPQINTALVAAGDDQETGWGTEFRRARLFFEGTAYEVIDFKAQYDFAGGDADFKDVYIGARKIPFVGHFRVGHFKEPVSLEELTSSKYITFMERSLPVEAFAPSRNMGFMFFNHALNERLTWAVGLFQNTDDFGESFNNASDQNLSLRLTGLPWYQDKGKLLHLGLSLSHQFRNERVSAVGVRYRTRPEAHLSPNRLADTRSLLTDSVDLINPEVALVYGPFSFQGEYFFNKLGSTPLNDPDFEGGYAYVSWFLTGEHRNYKASAGAFDRIKPKKNFHPTKEGWGALEVALRYSTVDLIEQGAIPIMGGEQKDWTFGINWYLTPNTRVMFNYVQADIKDGNEDVSLPNGKVDIYQFRFQIDF